jgi:hypothetical protein
MLEKDRKDEGAGPLIASGGVVLVFAALLLYAGYRFAMRDVCAAYDRLMPACWATIAASLLAITLSVFGARRLRGWRNKAVVAGVVVASIAVAGYAGALLLWVSSFAEFATDIRVFDDEGLRFELDEGYRVSALEVSGPGVRWRIEAAGGARPPLVQQVGGFAFGETPEGYVQVLSASEEQLKDGAYRVEATVRCAYRPAVSRFVIKESRIVSR